MRFKGKFRKILASLGMTAFAIGAHAQTLQGAALVEALRHGGYVLVMRHPNSPMALPSKDQANADNLKGERQLDAEGRASATAMGKALRDLKIPIGEVLSSPTYRALETVKYAQLGTAKTFPELGEDANGMQGGSEAQAQWLQDRVKKLPTGANTIIITHFPNLRSAFPQLAANVAEGEALVFGPDGKGGSTFVTRIKIEEWPTLVASQNPQDTVPLSPRAEPKVEAEGSKGGGDSRPVDCSVLAYRGTIPLAQVDNGANDRDFRGGMDCHFRVSDKAPIFTLHFAGRANNSLGDMEVMQGASTIQKITGHDFDLAGQELGIYVQAVDANFDGYQDVELLDNCGGTGNCQYTLYLYNPVENKFVYNKFLSGLTSPSFDEKKKQVKTVGNVSAIDWSTSTYEYRNGKYVEIERFVSDENETKTYELKDGKMVLVKSEENDDE